MILCVNKDKNHYTRATESVPNLSHVQIIELYGFVPKSLPLYRLIAIKRRWCWRHVLMAVGVLEGLVVGMREKGQILIAAQKCSLGGLILDAYIL